MLFFRKKDLELRNIVKLPIYGVAVLADKLNSYYSYTRHRGFPEHLVEVHKSNVIYRH